MIEQAIAAIDRQHTIEPCAAFPGDVIVITYKPDEIPVDLMRQEYERISSLFHDNLVIAIPDAVSFKSLSQAQFLELRDSLMSIIDERIGSGI